MGHKQWRQGITEEEELELFRLVGRGKTAAAELQAAESEGAVILSADELGRLKSEREAGEDACAQLAVAYRSFSAQLACHCKKTLPKRFELDELKNLAFVILHEFLRRFDPDLGVPFTAFAGKNLISEIKRRAYDNNDLVNMGRKSKDDRRRIGKAEDRLAAKLGRRPTLDELAKEVDLPVEQVSVLWQSQTPTSIDTMVESGGSEDHLTPVSTELISEPEGLQTGAVLHLKEAVSSMREFFEPLLAEKEGSVEQRHLAERIRCSLRRAESLVELREWLLSSPKPVTHDEEGKRPLEALQWRFLITAIGRHHINGAAGRSAHGARKKAPAHPSGTGALECRTRRRQVVDGRTLKAIRASRGSA